MLSLVKKEEIKEEEVEDILPQFIIDTCPVCNTVMESSIEKVRSKWLVYRCYSCSYYEAKDRITFEEEMLGLELIEGREYGY